MIWRLVRRWWRGDPPANATERRADLRTLKWMQLISSASLVLALIIWMVWLGER